MRKICAIVIGLVLASAGMAESPRIVDQDEFKRLWRVASERMPATIPPLAREVGPLIRKHGQIWVDREFVVDAEGNPSGYKLHGIEPADLDPRPFMALEMFLRYRPMDGVPATPVHVRGRGSFHMPRAPMEGED